jgi:hypothetical protein
MLTQWIDFTAKQDDPGIHGKAIRIFGLGIRGETYAQIRKRAEKIARSLAYAMHFYEITWELARGQYETNPEFYRTGGIIPSPYHHGGVGYTRPDDGMND